VPWCSKFYGFCTSLKDYTKYNKRTIRFLTNTGEKVLDLCIPNRRGVPKINLIYIINKDKGKITLQDTAGTKTIIQIDLEF